MGTTFTLKPYYRSATCEELIFDLQKTFEKVNQPRMSKAEYLRKGGIYSEKMIERRFGSWNKALEKAGINTTERRTIPTCELLENIKHIWLMLDKQPTYEDIRPPLSRHDIKTYVRRFGSWRKTLESFIEWHRASDKEAFIKTLPAPRSREINTTAYNAVLKRDNYKCIKCGASPAICSGVVLCVDHIIPRSKHGSNSADNLQTLCSRCNLKKGSRIET